MRHVPDVMTMVTLLRESANQVAGTQIVFAHFPYTSLDLFIYLKFALSFFTAVIASI